ncbi:hypothetical protein [Botrimarina hoheduenensis]|uniref:Cytochrome c domain-containing protein n=1 Tax=Botrimarina hoheduenensis TaxID=2528000 RepID=A0A5C5WB50_9BACT|nr:hypothetical protein [Botrimarina hoheduenensis]TWT47824.1 hypothetical protein Pla111_14480 [Botrimarina hoheduenensis]
MIRAFSLRAAWTRTAIAVALVALVPLPGAEAFPQFQKEFLTKYADGTDAAFTDTAKEAKCFVCHQGKNKKNRNAYGQALEAYLGKKDKKDVEKIVAALETVAAESSNAEAEGAPTFGELIAEGRLPGGTLEEAQQEPSED